MKRNFKKFAYNFIKFGGVTAFISTIVILGIFVKNSIHENEHISILDWTIFSSIVAALFLNSLSSLIQTLLLNSLEDSAKLTCNYKELTSKYKASMIEYDNTQASFNNLQKLKKSEFYVRIPVIKEYSLNVSTIYIQDFPTKKYKLPDLIQEHFNELIKAHSTSKIYNQLNIRVDDWGYKNGKFIIKTSRTTYFDSLVTNRAMDFEWAKDMSVRNLFEFGPFISPLNESCLSNHIGFNGFVISSDGYIPFVKRGKNLSIGKRTYGNSIGASLKAKYALNASREFTEKGLVKSILQEINDELKIPSNELETFSLNKHLIAAYRDLVEGGKPQFLFCIHSYWTKDMIEKNFRNIMRKKRVKKNLELLEDGQKFLWISINSIHEICILPDKIIHQEKIYHMMPSATAAIVMLIEHMNNEE